MTPRAARGMNFVAGLSYSQLSVAELCLHLPVTRRSGRLLIMVLVSGVKRASNTRPYNWPLLVHPILPLCSGIGQIKNSAAGQGSGTPWRRFGSSRSHDMIGSTQGWSRITADGVTQYLEV